MVHVPPWLLDTMVNFPSSGLAFLRRHVRLSNGIARRLIQSRLLDANDVDKKDALSRIGICVFLRVMWNTRVLIWTFILIQS